MYHDGAGCKISSCACKKKGKEFRGEGKAPWDDILTSSSHSIRTVSKMAIGFGIVLAVLCILSISLTCYGIVSDIPDDSLFIFEIQLLTFFVYLILFIITLCWYYHATKNIRSFGANEVTSPIMAVIWWFIPIFNIWKPYTIAKQISKSSNPEIKLTLGTEWKSNSSSRLIKPWWVFGSIFVGLMIYLPISGFLISSYDEDLEQFPKQNSDELPMKSEHTVVSRIGVTILAMFLLTSTVFFILMIKQISTWQEIKSHT